MKLRTLNERLDSLEAAIKPQAIAGYKRAVDNLRSSRDEVRMALGAQPGERTAEAARRVRHDTDGRISGLKTEIVDLKAEVEHFKDLVSKTAAARDIARRERDEALKELAAYKTPGAGSPSDWADLRRALDLPPTYTAGGKFLAEEVIKLVDMRKAVRAAVDDGSARKVIEVQNWAENLRYLDEVSEVKDKIKELTK